MSEITAKKDNVLTGRVFRITFASFFVSNIMTVLGTVIDGFVVGNTMDKASIAAVGLVSPVIILFTVIGTTAGISFQVRSLRCLGKGDTDGAGRALTETLILGLALSVLLMALALCRPDNLIRLIGVSENSRAFSGCIDYIKGTAVGLPAMTAMAILTRGVQIDGAPRVAVISVMVMAAANIIGDYIGAVRFNTGLYGLTLGTSISYYAGVLVLLRYYRKPDVLIRPVAKGISLIETLKVNNIGMWGGIMSVVYSLTLVLRADIMNMAIELFNVGDVGLQAYHVQVQMSYIVNASQNSAISMMFLLGALCRAEEDRISFKKIIGKVVKYDVLNAAALSMIMILFAGIIARLYLRGADAELLGSAAGVLRAYSAGLVFQIVVILFANYLQVFNHNILSAFVIIVSNVITTLFGASYGGAFGRMTSGRIVVSMFWGITICHILSAFLLPLLVPLANRRIRGRDLHWMMPYNFGVSPENELRAVITTQDDVMEFSQKAWEFCDAKGMPERTAYLTSLAIEEMATNVVKHGFARDEKDHTLSVRLVVKDDGLILRFRDDSPGFDPRSKYETIFRNPDISRMIGLRMIMAEAREVSYTSMFSLNNLIIRIGTTD